MSERDIFVMYHLQILELIADCVKMTVQEYNNWKDQTLSTTVEEAKDFMKKIFYIVDKHRKQ